MLALKNITFEYAPLLPEIERGKYYPPSMDYKAEYFVWYFLGRKKGHLKISKSSFLQQSFCSTSMLFKTFLECQHYEDTNPTSYKTTFMPKSC